MKTSLAILFFTLGCYSSIAQKTDVSNGIKLNNKASKFKLLGKVDGKYIVERYSDDTHILDFYNRFLKLQSSKTLTLNKNERLKRIWITPQKSWIIKLVHHREKSYIEALQLDKNQRLSSKPIVLDSLSERSDLLNNNLRTTLSLNEDKLLLYTPVFKNGSISYFYTKTFSNNLQKINQKNLTNDEVLNNDFIDLYLFNNGSYLLITSSDKNADDAIYYLNYVDTLGNLKTTIYNPIQTIYKKLKFEIDNLTQSVLISGFYRAPKENRRDNTGASKFFITKINVNTSENVYTDISPFSETFYQKLTGNKSNKTPPQLYTFYIKDIIAKNDGGCVILTESYFKNEEQSLNNTYFSISGMSNYSTSTIYNFNDIIVYNVDSSGIIDIPKIIRKKQVSSNDYGSYSSFYTANLQDELKIIFLDDISSDAQLLQQSIAGKIERNSSALLNIGNEDIVPIVKLGLQTAPNEFLFPSLTRNKLKLIKVVF